MVDVLTGLPLRLQQQLDERFSQLTVRSLDDNVNPFDGPDAISEAYQSHE